MNLREELFKLQDLKYREFHKKLIPDVDESTFIGVRVPELRKLAKLAHKENVEILDEYYEEKMVHGFVIGLKKCSLEEHKDDLSHFVKLIDNWAICDCGCSSFKFVKHYQEELFDFIVSFIGKGEYQTRFAIVMLMNYYLDDRYIDMVIDIYKSINSDYYYIYMGVAWGICAAFVKYQQKITSLLKQRVLNRDVQNKAIQKICDSYRVDRKTKEYIKTLKISK